jgi:hypothetical protein
VALNDTDESLCSTHDLRKPAIEHQKFLINHKLVSSGTRGLGLGARVVRVLYLSRPSCVILFSTHLHKYDCGENRGCLFLLPEARWQLGEVSAGAAPVSELRLF